MAAKPKTKATPQPANSRCDPAVAEFIRKLKHAMKPDLESLRQLILAVSPAIGEGIKWNSPSFRTTDWFATINLRARDGKQRVWLILHTGAKVKESATKGVRIADPKGLLEWLAKDRAMITLDADKSVKSNRSAIQNIIRQWIRYI